MTIRLHRGDLPDLSAYKGAVAIDTETMGLDPHRDRLCVVQLSPGDGSADVVQIAAGQNKAPNIERLLADPSDPQDFPLRPLRPRHDGQGLRRHGRSRSIAPRSPRGSTRTYTDKHGLKDLARELLGIDLSKQQQSSDWGADSLTDAQVAYAATDVLHLHALKEKLDAHAGARGPQRAGRRLLRLPARAGAARPGRLGRRGYLFAQRVILLSSGFGSQQAPAICG